MNPILPLIAALGIASATPIPPSRISPKLALFERTQLLCESTALSSQKMAEDIEGSGVSSLRDICECSALLAVAPLDDEQATGIMSSESDRPDFLKATAAAMDRCIRLNVAK